MRGAAGGRVKDRLSVALTHTRRAYRRRRARITRIAIKMIIALPWWDESRRVVSHRECPEADDGDAGNIAGALTTQRDRTSQNGSFHQSANARPRASPLNLA